MYYWIAVDYFYQIYSRGGYATYGRAHEALFDFINNYVISNGEGIMEYKVRCIQ